MRRYDKVQKKWKNGQARRVLDRETGSMTKSNVPPTSILERLQALYSRAAREPQTGGDNVDSLASEDKPSAELVQFLQLKDLSRSENEKASEQSADEEAASYIADLLTSLEYLAQKNDLSVLSYMIAMAREQATEDAGLARPLRNQI